MRSMVTSRLVRRAKDLINERVRARKRRAFRNCTRSAKRLAHKIGRMALGRTEQAQATYQASYGKLVEVARASIKQAGRVRTLLEEGAPARKILEELSHFAHLLEQTISQTRRRVFEGAGFGQRKIGFHLRGAHEHNQRQGTQ